MRISLSSVSENKDTGQFFYQRKRNVCIYIVVKLTWGFSFRFQEVSGALSLFPFPASWRTASQSWFQGSHQAWSYWKLRQSFFLVFLDSWEDITSFKYVHTPRWGTHGNVCWGCVLLPESEFGLSFGNYGLSQQDLSTWLKMQVSRPHTRPPGVSALFIPAVIITHVKVWVRYISSLRCDH